MVGVWGQGFSKSSLLSRTPSLTILQADLGELQGLQSGFKGPVSMIDGGLFDSVKAYKDSKVGGLGPAARVLNPTHAAVYGRRCCVLPAPTQLAAFHH